MVGLDCRLVVDMVACMAKEGVGPYARQGWAGRGGVWGWDSRATVSLDRRCMSKQMSDQQRHKQLMKTKTTII